MTQSTVSALRHTRVTDLNNFVKTVGSGALHESRVGEVRYVHVELLASGVSGRNIPDKKDFTLDYFLRIFIGVALPSCQDYPRALGLRKALLVDGPSGTHAPGPPLYSPPWGGRSRDGRRTGPVGV